MQSQASSVLQHSPTEQVLALCKPSGLRPLYRYIACGGLMVPPRSVDGGDHVQQGLVGVDRWVDETDTLEDAPWENDGRIRCGP